MWLRSSDLSRRAVLKLGPVGESVSDRSAIVGHFSAPGEMAFSFPAQLLSPPERYMEPKDDRPPSTEGQIVEETVVTR